MNRLLIGALLFALAGCGAGVGTTTHEIRQSAASDRPAAGHPATDPLRRPAEPRERRTHSIVAVRLIRTTYGRAVADARGFALYSFTRDRSRSSTCYDACAVAWPPYLVSKGSVAGTGRVDGRLLGTLRRRDGRLQVTYAGHPLYHYVGDRRPGDVLCQAVSEFGGIWYVLASNGDAIH